MSLTTKIHGFTAWINLRLAPKGYVLHNVLTDLLKGYHMKVLLESLTGKQSRRIDTFDGLSLAQKQTRVEWMLDELKRMEVVKGTVDFDSKMFAMRSADSVFDFLWCLVCHDIWFVWERSSFMQQDNERRLIAKPFMWIPPEPPAKKPVAKHDVSLLSGFGAQSLIRQDEEEKRETERWTSRAALMKRDEEMIQPAKSKKTGLYPSPDCCIIKLVQSHLKMTKEGQKLVKGVSVLEDLGDSRVLCALLNSFVPDTFTSEVLLNDRWTVNLALETISHIFRCSSPFNAEDFVEADVTAVCAYFTFFFMCGYQYRQARAVINRKEALDTRKLIVDNEIAELRKLGDLSVKYISEYPELEDEMNIIDEELASLENRYDIEGFITWMNDVALVQEQVREIVSRKMKEQYEIITVPSTLTINEIVSDMMINLSLTSGTGFYEAKFKETLTKERKIVARDIHSNEFYDDGVKSGKSRGNVRGILGIPTEEHIEINPDDFPSYELFFDSPSKNKLLKAGTRFLYRVFPGSNVISQKMLFKAALNGDLDVVRKLVRFFKHDNSFVNSKEKGTRNTALHIACRHGHFNIVLFLLENNADVNCENTFGATPFFMATEGFHKDVSALLIEWDADILHKNRHGKTALELMKHGELRDSLSDKFCSVKKLTKSVMEKDCSVLRQQIQDHHSGQRKFASLRSRLINGSTLLHTAAYYGEHELVKILLAEGVDVNLSDYVGASALHRAKDIITVELLLDAGADAGALDADKNNALHIQCYGEPNHNVDFAVLSKLIEAKVSLTARNKRDLMPIHCCALQGKHDVISYLLGQDTEGLVMDAVMNEDKLPPSLLHLSAANNHLDCAKWLQQHGLSFKTEEPDILLEKVLMDQIPCDDYRETVDFLLHSGASSNVIYPGGNTALHLAASQPHMTDTIQLLLDNGAHVNALNADHCTALFFAARSDNVFGASVLIQFGADMTLRNFQGQTAFDLIIDLDEWIDSGCFNDEALTRLKAHSLKQARNLVRTISKKVKGLSIVPLSLRESTRSQTVQRSRSVPTLLPPIEGISRIGER